MANTLNIIIVADNALVVHGLKNQLRGRFGSIINITCLYDFKSLLKTVDKDTDVVVVDPLMEGKKGGDVLRSAKVLNPNITGIFHTSSDDVADTLHRLLLSMPQASGQGSYSFAYN